MIRITVQDFFIIYLSVFFVVIFILWIRELARVKAYEWNISEPSLCFCGKCHYGFLVKAGEKLAYCPRCNDLCVVKKNKGKKI